MTPDAQDDLADPANKLITPTAKARDHRKQQEQIAADLREREAIRQPASKGN